MSCENVFYIYENNEKRTGFKANPVCECYAVVLIGRMIDQLAGAVASPIF
jgi:hypothetical protein